MKKSKASNGYSFFSMSCPIDRDIMYLNGILMVLVQVVAIVGNCLFFIGLIKFPQMRNATNIFLCCLASADIIVALVPMSATFAIFICQWGPTSQQDQFHKDITLFYIIVDISCGTASILSLTVIAMDRYFAINWPFVHQRVVKPRTAAIAVGAVWTVALVTSVIRLDEDVPRKTFTLLNLLISFIIPLIIMSFCYINIAIIARRQAIRIAQLNAAGSSLQRRCEQDTETTNDDLSSKAENSDKRKEENDDTSGQHNEEEIGKSRESRLKSLRRGTINAVSRMKAVGKELKAAKTLGIVMGVFIITWTPFMSVNIISYIHCQPYTSKCTEMLTYDRVMYIKLLHYLSSALNPCLYVLLNKNWRQVFHRMLCCCMQNRISAEARTSILGGW